MEIAPAVLAAHDGVGNAPDSTSDSSASTVPVNNNNMSSNRYVDDDGEDEDVCRICRNSGDADNPLRKAIETASSDTIVSYLDYLKSNIDFV